SELLLVEHAQIRSVAAQHQQRCEVKQSAEDLDPATSELECRGEHRPGPAHRFEQLVEQYRRCDLACHLDQLNRESKPVRGLIGEDVGSRRRGVTHYDEAIADKAWA